MSTPDFEQLKQQFQQQNSDLTHLQQVLSSLGPDVGLPLELLSQLDAALDVSPPRRASRPLPLGQRA